nr:uncharacterized protein I203_00780 [Kwoniella mangroviensis CBS 8507]OCF70645.1 hypothetical protein I203_00780 [Kwoniella mangroviensis CBS 8507]
MGIIEWLPWKEGLKCYRTRWDWLMVWPDPVEDRFADVLGEFMLTILQLQNHEFSQGGMKGM